jgi:long-chain acyl-CoA synthetase
MRTLCELYLETVSQRARPDMFRHKIDGSWRDVSTAAMHQAVIEASLGLVSLGISPGDRIALLSENRIEWAMLDLAALCCGASIVPVYPSLLPPQIEYILRDSEATALACSSREHVERTAPICERLGTIRHRIAFDATTQDGVLGFAALRALGADHLARHPADFEQRIAGIRPQDLATIIYTSGTTGDPKGVLLTHANLAQNVVATLQTIPVFRSDSCLSLLPLSHIFERVGGFYIMLYAGVSIAYAESFDRAAANLAEIRPTIMVAVPRLYEKIHARAQNTAAQGGALKATIFHWAKQVGSEFVRRQVAGRPSLWLRLRMRIADRLVFRKLRARTGGKLRLFVSGGAPLPLEIAEFFEAAGLPILEGYGLTETSPIITVNSLEHRRAGSVGRAIPGVELRIAEDGEILTRGTCVMRGYLNKPDATAAAIVDGWFLTGDIGHLDSDGYLFITDRKKDLIVTAGGKNVAPQPIENALKSDRYVSEAIVIGDRRKYLTALIIPNFESLGLYAKRHAIEPTDRSALAQHDTIRSLMQHVVDKVNAQLASFEQIKYFRLLDHDLSLEAGELTPSMKVKRKVIVTKYAALIDSMYAES